MKWGKYKSFYHVSPYRMVPGTRITPFCKDKNYNCSFNNSVHINCSPTPHFTIIPKIISDKESEGKDWFIYKVVPIGKLFIGNWDDIVCYSAEVISCHGTAYNVAKRTKVKMENVSLPCDSLVISKRFKQTRRKF